MRCKLTVVALTATIILATAVAGASARNLSVSNARFRIAWAPLSLNEPGGLGLRCNTTMEGSFHTATIAKVARSLIGFVTRLRVAQETCRTSLFTSARVIPWNGEEVSLGATIGQSLPWHITYEAFRGTLPTITGVVLLLRGMRLRIETPATGCLGDYGRAETNLRFIMNVFNGEATTLTPEPNPTIPLLHEIIPECPVSLGLSGNGTITLLGTTSRIRVTLI